VAIEFFDLTIWKHSGEFISRLRGPFKIWNYESIFTTMSAFDHKLAITDISADFR